MVTDGDQAQRSYSWKAFQDFIGELSVEKSEMVLLEILNAPITSILVAGIDLIKRNISSLSIIRMEDAFLESILTHFFLNFNSNLYTLESRNILEDFNLLKERIPVLSHVLNFCKLLILTDGTKFKVRYY